MFVYLCHGAHLEVREHSKCSFVLHCETWEQNLRCCVSTSNDFTHWAILLDLQLRKSKKKISYKMRGHFCLLCTQCFSKDEIQMDNECIKMLTFHSHQGNKYQNDIEILYHSSEKGKHWASFGILIKFCYKCILTNQLKGFTLVYIARGARVHFHHERKTWQ